MDKVTDKIIETIISLPFELVDYALEYIGFKRSVNFYEAGNKENFKIEVILYKLINH